MVDKCPYEMIKIPQIAMHLVCFSRDKLGKNTLLTIHIVFPFTYNNIISNLINKVYTL
jgi:hypothetical protein